MVVRSAVSPVRGPRVKSCHVRPRAGVNPSGGPAHPGRARPSDHELFGWKKSKLSTRFDHLPSTLMDESVVVMTEEYFVGHVIRPASAPKDDVMRTRPVDRPVATGEPATLVSRSQRPAPGRRGHSRRPPDVHHHRVSQQDAGDSGGTGGAPPRLARG